MLYYENRKKNVDYHFENFSQGVPDSDFFSIRVIQLRQQENLTIFRSSRRTEKYQLNAWQRSKRISISCMTTIEKKHPAKRSESCWGLKVIPCLINNCHISFNVSHPPTEAASKGTMFGKQPASNSYPLIVFCITNCILVGVLIEDR